MFSLLLLSILVAWGAGLIVKFALDLLQGSKNITWREYMVGMLVIAVAITPLVTGIGWRVAKSNNLSFNEYWNGWEKKAVWTKTPCYRDGPCAWSYDCDEYTVQESYSCNCDDKGNCDTCYRSETRYHQCPYCTEEWTFVVDTTLGPFTIAEHRLPEAPNSNRWRLYESVPQGVISRAGAGVHPFWAAVKARLDVGRPGPVTKRMQYDNYILASERTILKQYSSLVEQYASAKLLPPVQNGIRDFYYSDKVQFVGYAPGDLRAWQESLMYLNAALGTELQGDAHLVVVQNETVSANPDVYILTLKAFWQNRKVFGDNAISKNSIIVVVGTADGKSVAWARATTGMPLGNESMVIALQSRLAGMPLTPEAINGGVKGEFYSEEKEDGTKKVNIRGLRNDGVLAQVLWGMDDSQTKFQRVSMSALDKDDFGSGFLYLKSEIEPSGMQKFWIVLVSFLTCLIVWFILALVGERTWKRHEDLRRGGAQ